MKMSQRKTRLAWSSPESEDSRFHTLNVSSVIVNSAKEFFMNTSLHGFKYLVEENRTFVEKVWWCVAIMASVAACGWLLGDVYAKWNETPIIVTFASELETINLIVFPAVTICSEIKIVGETFEEVVPDGGQRSHQLKYAFEDIKNLICANNTMSQDNVTVDWKTGMFLLKKMSPALEDVVSDCKFRGKSLKCSSLFQQTVTDVGVCYTFNGLNAEQLYRDEMIRRDSFEEKDVDAKMRNEIREGDLKSIVFPRGVDESNTQKRIGDVNITARKRDEMEGMFGLVHMHSSAGPKSGLSLILHFNDTHDDSRNCGVQIDGFKGLFHDMKDVPIMRNKYFLIPTGQVLMAAIKPSTFKTNLKLRKYSPEKRNCYFTFERNLRYFKVYSQENCELECVTNYTLERCSCAAMFMPSNATVPLCTSGGSIKCVENISNTVYDRQWTLTACKCLPTCYKIIYDVEYSQARFEYRNLAGNASVSSNKSTHLFVYFKEAHVLQKVRNEIFSNTDILASCGGLLGLFLGFSVLSLVEPAYYFTLRIFSNIKAKQKV